jgi:hypothetical protein
MRMMIAVLVACVALALIRAAIMALTLLLSVLLIWFAIRHPRETAVVLTYLIFFGLLTAYPWAFVAFIGLAILASAMDKQP